MVNRKYIQKEKITDLTFAKNLDTFEKYHQGEEIYLCLSIVSELLQQS